MKSIEQQKSEIVSGIVSAMELLNQSPKAKTTVISGVNTLLFAPVAKEMGAEISASEGSVLASFFGFRISSCAILCGKNALQITKV